MRNYILLLGLLVFILHPLFIFAQHCNQPDFYNSNNNITQENFNNLQELSIPVVIHLIYNESKENISDSLIANQINILNQLYSNLITSQREAFRPITGSPKLSFNLTNTTKTKTNKISFNNGESLGVYDSPKYSHLGGVNSWNTNLYLNIWICNLDAPDQNIQSLLGYAFPPTLANDWDYTSFVSPERQGVVINYRCFLDSQYFNILAHEIGHYLGLKHIWGNSEYSCDNDDGIDDTPLSATPSYTCDFSKNTCNTGADDLPDMVENIMDYSPASCGKYFTYGQVQRMISNLVYLRPNLYTAEPGEDSVTIIEAFPNPSFGKFTVFLHTKEVPKSTLEILDLTGKIVYSTVFNNNKQLVEIPPEHYRHGLYILRLHNEKYCLTKKIQFLDR